MKLLKYVRLIGGITFLSLTYIYLQMEIVHLAYEGKDKQQKIKKLDEQRQVLTYKILTLESAPHVGDKILAENSGMGFIHPDNVIQIATTDDFFSKRDNDLLAQNKGPLRQFLNAFSWETQAAAQIK